jgi:hypothetical protein
LNAYFHFKSDWMKKFYIAILCIFWFLSLQAQVNNGPRFTALGNASVALQDVWSASKNQAGIAGLKNPFIAAGYENRFSISELNSQSAVFSIPINNYAIGGSFQNYGLDAYKENKVGFTLARSFGPNLFIAVGANYHQLKINNYGDAKSVSIDLSLQYQLFPKLWLGTHIANPSQSKYGENADQIIPTAIRFGGNYIFSDQLLITTEFEKVLDAKADFKAGLEYKLVKTVALRGGISINPFKQFAGFGINYKKVLIDFAVASHPVLGYSPQIGLGYEF